jgi:hypothetical protein
MLKIKKGLRNEDNPKSTTPHQDAELVTMAEFTEKTQTRIFDPQIDGDPDLQNFLIDVDVDNILSHVILWLTILVLMNIFAW